jgi:predicted Zn-dependent protease
MSLPAARAATRSLFATAALLLLAACALGPLQVDRGARAPELAGFGRSEMTIASGSAEARRWFAQGMEQAYAFNETEAVRAFKAGLAQDPACAMCAWGVAYQLGPNINNTEREDLREALRYVDLAMRNAANLPPRDRGLIEALALRYGHASEARNTAVLTAPVCSAGGGSEVADPLDIAYAERMRELADRFPDDADVLSIYAEAEMIATRDDAWWDAQTAAPAGRLGEVANRLEAALKQHPEHVGLNHYLIHAVDALPVAARAEAAADRLGRLAPASPHLLHMPAHTYLQLGRYADASRVNQQALAADDAQDAELGRQGFSITKDWRNHDGQFLWYAALMEGRGELALQTARSSAARAARGESAFAEFVRSRPLLTLVRLERWDDTLREPIAAGNKGVATLLGEYAHGVALARSGQPQRAAEALARLEPAADALIAAHASNDNRDKMMRGIAETSRARLRAEVAFSEGRIDAALAEQVRALAFGKDLDETEPPMLAAENRLALGDMQLKARRWVDAEQSFRADLAQHPRSGWALRGLTRALAEQGRDAEAQAVRAELAHGWLTADASLVNPTSSPAR